MDIVVKAAQLILALVILVTVHEFGHYITARIFKMRVSRFYLFFNPWFSLLRYEPRTGKLFFLSDTDKEGNTKAVKTFQVGKPHPAVEGADPTWRDTVYGLGWVPLGGYCDIAGMVDETTSADELSAEPEPWEFRAKPRWQRLIVMVAGVVMNFLLAILIYIGVVWHWGEDMVPFSEMKEGLDFSDEFVATGFQNGDRLLSINGKPVDVRDYALNWDLIQPGAQVGVLRGNDTVVVAINENLLKSMLTKGKDYIPWSVRVPVYVAKVVTGEPAQKAGLQVMDRIVMVGNDTTPTITEFRPALMAHKGETVPVKIVHEDGVSETKDVAIGESGKIGITMLSPSEIFRSEAVEYSFFEAVPRGWEIGTTQLTTYVSSLSAVFSKEGAQSLGGFGALGDLYGNQWNWRLFWQITAFLSIILAFMNIIPIPGLDGGYTLFLLVEIISRRKISEKFIGYANMVGIFILFALMILANGNDIYRAFFK